MLRVQASNETLEGSGSKDLVSERIPRGYRSYHRWLGPEAYHNLCSVQQPDRNTENDISIRDCCRYFRWNTQDPVFLLSGDINLSIRGESDGGLLGVINDISVLFLIILFADRWIFQTFRLWNRERAGQAELSPAVSLVLMRAEDLTDTFSPRYARAELPLIFSRRRVQSWSIG